MFFLWENNSFIETSTDNMHIVETPKLMETRDGNNQEIFEKLWIENYTEGFAGGTGKENDPYQISSAEELAYFMFSVQDRCESKTKNTYYILTKDIYLNDGYFEEDGTYHDGGDGQLYYWTPIGTSIHGPFSGFFDGNGKTIYGMYINSDQNNQGLFMCVNGTIKNLKVKNAYVTAKSGSSFIAGAAGANKSIFENIVVEGFIDAVGSAGGIAAHSMYGGASFVDCKVYGKIKATTTMAGILQSDNTRNGFFKRCENYADLVHTGTQGIAAGIAMVYGEYDLYDCKNYGDISGTYSISGIANSVRTVDNCENYGNIYTKNGRRAGIANSVSARMTNCKNYGDSWAGIVVFVKTGSIVSYCENYGNSMYGIAYENKEKGVIANCKVFATSTYDYFYGLVDSNSGQIKNVEIYFTGPIKTLVVFCGRNYEQGSLENILFYGEKLIFPRYFLITNNLGKAKNLISSFDTSKEYLVEDFSKFYVDWKTGKIGIKSISGKGFYQSALTEEWLSNKGFTKFSL